MHIRRIVMADIVLFACTAGAQAQSFPSKAGRIVVGFAPGGNTDLVARITAQHLQERIGQSVVVENRAGGGASAAAKVGALAALVRSVTPYSMRTPHTGAMNYDTTVAKIPTAAITVEDAMMIHRMVSRGEPVVVKLEMEAQTLPDVMSRNVMAEIRGSEKPDEIIAFGGHIDSWDVGQGAMDDGGGVIVSKTTPIAAITEGARFAACVDPSPSLRSTAVALPNDSARKNTHARQVK